VAWRVVCVACVACGRGGGEEGRRGGGGREGRGRRVACDGVHLVDDHLSLLEHEERLCGAALAHDHLAWQELARAEGSEEPLFFGAREALRQRGRGGGRGA